MGKIVTEIRENKVSPAGETGINLEYPVGEPVDLLEVLIRSTNLTMPFSKFYVVFYDPSKTTKRKPISKGIIPNCYPRGEVLFRGRTSWPRGFTLSIRGYSQTALTEVQITIVYEIIDEPERRRRWGE